MSTLKALVICDEPIRRDFLFNVLTNAGYFPVWYQNIFAYRKAINQDEIHLIVADLSIPIEPKIDIIIRGSKNSAKPRLITIGKIEFLKSTNILDDYRVDILEDINEFPALFQK